MLLHADAGGRAADGDEAFVTEAAYSAHSLTARWLHRAPVAGGVAANDEETVPAGAGAGAAARESQPCAAPVAGLHGAGTSALRHSSLTWEDHAWYLRASLPDVSARLTPAELERLRRLEVAVAAEQAAYARERAAAGASAEALRFYHPDVAAQARRAVARRGHKLCGAVR